MPRLILASQSPDRLRLLRDAGFEVEVVASTADEPDPAAFGDRNAGLMYLAQWKALSAASRGARGLIVAADTVGLVAGQVLGKPSDRNDARRMLQAISGARHSVLTGWCLLRTRDNLAIAGVEETAITMRAWSEAELNDYLDGGQWIGRSGAYAIGQPRDPFIEQIEGSVSNVVGLPLERLRSVLDEFGTLWS